MNALFEQLGINWKLFLSQTVNFFILLIVLRAFVYKPLLIVIKKRNDKIKEGLAKAEEADIRLKEVDSIAKDKLKQADQDSIGIIKKTEEKAKILDKQIQDRAEQKQKEINELLKQSFVKQQEEAKDKVLSQAAELIKKTIIKTVELKPDAIDEALIKKAVAEIKNETE
jgi:F-type H+-transporting ATPase subunit b